MTYPQVIAPTVFLALLVDCASSKDGTPIPGTKISSCGDLLLAGNMVAPPTMVLTNPTVTVLEESTTLTGGLSYQPSCVQNKGETEYRMTEVSVYHDAAGYPGMLIGSTSIDVVFTVTCGVTKDFNQNLSATPIPHLRQVCDAYLAKQGGAGSTLPIIVEVSGKATTCSNEVSVQRSQRPTRVACR